mmetsp:Transcript_5937/g.12953  ORF Transcript_5937/g.12953 Transcript_5937/m.12953 type:complete len:419 (-) Transcript_5937:297-1553(-)
MKAAMGPSSVPPPGALERRKMKSVHSMEVGQSEGRLKEPGFIGMTIGSFHLKTAFQLSEVCSPLLARCAEIESDEKGRSVMILRMGLSEACEVQHHSSSFSSGASEPPSTGSTACHSSSSEGIQVGCRQKPTTGMEKTSPHMSAMDLSVKALMIMSTGCALSCNTASWRRKTGAEAKKLDSDAASISSCSSSVRELMISLEIADSVCRCVSPPEVRKCTAPLLTSAQLPTTKLRHRSSVQMVTRQPSSLQRPRASATKGCTSPRVPRDMMKMWRCGACVSLACARHPRGAPVDCTVGGQADSTSLVGASPRSAVRPQVRKHAVSGSPLMRGSPSLSSSSRSCGPTGASPSASTSVACALVVPTKCVVRQPQSRCSSSSSSLSTAKGPHELAARPSRTSAFHSTRLPAASHLAVCVRPR